MKRSLLFFSLLCSVTAAFSQTSSYDPSFRSLYKAIALHPGYRNRIGQIHDSVVKKWDKNIVIFIEGGNSKNRREIVDKLKGTIATISPALNNKIQISFTDNKPSANYLINLDYRGRSGWHLKWDGIYNIYGCTMLINAKAIFNYDEQAGLISHYFLQSLGDFVFNQQDKPVFTKDDPTVASNMSLWRKEITDVDLRIVKVHYADGIKAGMTAKDIDQFFDQQGK